LKYFIFLVTEKWTQKARVFLDYTEPDRLARETLQLTGPIGELRRK
jgi:hypothetical protein